MNIEKQIENLKKLHTAYTEEVKLLTEKRDRVIQALKNSTDRMVQTFEAIQVLEGKKSSLKETLQSTLAKMGWKNPEEIISNAPIPIVTDGGVVPEGLPPAEPGYKWAKNELNEDILVPINPPKTITSESFYLGNLKAAPIETEDFETDPRNLLDI